MHTLSLVANTVKKNLLFRLYKHYIIDSVVIVKKSGFRELFRRRGLKFLLVIFTYYLVRDTFVYILIPLCIAKGIL
jgi:hypothetical protein